MQANREALNWAVFAGYIPERLRDGRKTFKGITYWPTFITARDFAVANKLPADRIISYGRGWAIQREVSGPYWNATTGTWA